MPRLTGNDLLANNNTITTIRLKQHRWLSRALPKPKPTVPYPLGSALPRLRRNKRQLRSRQKFHKLLADHVANSHGRPSNPLALRRSLSRAMFRTSASASHTNSGSPSQPSSTSATRRARLTAAPDSAASIGSANSTPSSSPTRSALRRI